MTFRRTHQMGIKLDQWEALKSQYGGGTWKDYKTHPEDWDRLWTIIPEEFEYPLSNYSSYYRQGFQVRIIIPTVPEEDQGSPSDFVNFPFNIQTILGSHHHEQQGEWLLVGTLDSGHFFFFRTYETDSGLDASGDIHLSMARTFEQLKQDMTKTDLKTLRL